MLGSSIWLWLGLAWTVAWVDHVAAATNGSWSMPWLDDYLPDAESYRVTGPIYDFFFYPDVQAIVEKSYAGYINVGPYSDPSVVSNLFFWYFPAEIETNELVVYLNGGPGCSGMVGLFKVNGPISYDNWDFFPNPYSWHKKAHVVYVDQPFFTGLSYSNTANYAKNEFQVSQAMYTFLRRFLYIFKDLQGARVHLAGESFAGQYLPFLYNTIQVRNQALRGASSWMSTFAELIAQYIPGYTFTAVPNDSGIINLGALLVMSPWFSPREQYMSNLPFILQFQSEFGFDDYDIQYLTQIQAACQNQVSLNEKTYIDVCEAIIGYVSAIFMGTTDRPQCMNAYNVQAGFKGVCTDTTTTGDLSLLIMANSAYFRAATHTDAEGSPAGFTPCSSPVQSALQVDGSGASRRIIEQLLDSGNSIILASGAYDVISNHIGIQRALAGMTWGGETGFSATASYANVTMSNGGTSTVVRDRGLTLIQVSDAGHYIPQDNGPAGYLILDQVLAG
ncbi:hypothetical protein CXG81DRAFT_26411 [Caulochytrium protostelioides]|nr:hypothetical protein CXG81DRAFT_26411 [Caulochytrium protostelioides]|eukprot:RKP00872.1 hypothetical protein CXG81DRAFT_26411 [Caulochytrium protostelioides]